MFKSLFSLWLCALLLIVATATPPSHAADQAGQNDEKAAQKDDKTTQKPRNLVFDTIVEGRRSVIASITLPDGGKIIRETEPAQGRDGKDAGFRVLSGYRMPGGTLVEKDIVRNADGTISVLDINSDGRHPDRHEQRMSEREFIDWAKSN